MQDFTDRVAVITGGGSGIGAALAEAFAGAGARIVLADVDEQGMDAVAARLRAGGAAALAVRTDVTRLDEMHALAERAFAHFGGVHLLCNNAGVIAVGGMERVTHRDWQWVIGVNLWGVIHGIEAFVPRMIAQAQGGHIVNTASMSGLVPMQGMGVYVTTKYAVVGLSETLQRDLSAYGIGVTVLCPMVVRTNINASERNRPPALCNEDPAPVMPADLALAGGVIEPVDVATKTLAAIRANELYVITHPASRDIIARRFGRLDKAAARA